MTAGSLGDKLFYIESICVDEAYPCCLRLYPDRVHLIHYSSIPDYLSTARLPQLPAINWNCLMLNAAYQGCWIKTAFRSMLHALGQCSSVVIAADEPGVPRYWGAVPTVSILLAAYSTALVS